MSGEKKDRKKKGPEKGRKHDAFTDTEEDEGPKNYLLRGKNSNFKSMWFPFPTGRSRLTVS